MISDILKKGLGGPWFELDKNKDNNVLSSNCYKTEIKGHHPTNRIQFSLKKGVFIYLSIG